MHAYRQGASISGNRQRVLSVHVRVCLCVLSPPVRQGALQAPTPPPWEGAIDPIREGRQAIPISVCSRVRV